jgi:hypothetical protein
MSVQPRAEPFDSSAQAYGSWEFHKSEHTPQLFGLLILSSSSFLRHSPGKFVRRTEVSAILAERSSRWASGDRSRSSDACCATRARAICPTPRTLRAAPLSSAPRPPHQRHASNLVQIRRSPRPSPRSQPPPPFLLGPAQELHRWHEDAAAAARLLRHARSLPDSERLALLRWHRF